MNRYLDTNGNLVTKRLHVIYQDIPGFVAAIVGNVVTYAGEESIVNHKEKTLTIRTKNINLTSIVEVKEFCTDSPCRNDDSRTQYMKRMTVQGWMKGFINCTLESWFVDVDKKNRGNGINVMDEIIGGFSQLVLPMKRDF